MVLHCICRKFTNCLRNAETKRRFFPLQRAGKQPFHPAVAVCRRPKHGLPCPPPPHEPPHAAATIRRRSRQRQASAAQTAGPPFLNTGLHLCRNRAPSSLKVGPSFADTWLHHQPRRALPSVRPKPPTSRTCGKGRLHAAPNLLKNSTTDGRPLPEKRYLCSLPVPSAAPVCEHSALHPCPCCWPSVACSASIHDRSGPKKRSP